MIREQREPELTPEHGPWCALPAMLDVTPGPNGVKASSASAAALAFADIGFRARCP